MEPKYGAIDNLIVQHLSSLVFNTFHPQDAQKNLLEMWYKASELKGALYLALDELIREEVAKKQ